MRRNMTVLALAATLSALAVPALAQAPAPRLTDIKVSYAAPSYAYAAMIVAGAKGFFKKHGVNPEFIFTPGAPVPSGGRGR